VPAVLNLITVCQQDFFAVGPRSETVTLMALPGRCPAACFVELVHTLRSFVAIVGAHRRAAAGRLRQGQYAPFLRRSTRGNDCQNRLHEQLLQPPGDIDL